MTDTQTPEELFLKQATPLVQFIESQGGPKMYEWCDIIEGEVVTINMDEEQCEGCETWRLPLAFNPPAVASAVCMWVMDVSHWLSRQRDMWCAVAPCGTGEGEGFIWGIESDDPKSGHSPTKELSFFYLLTAICEALGYEAGDNK